MPKCRELYFAREDLDATPKGDFKLKSRTWFGNI